MMELLTELRIAVCRNCSTIIRELVDEMSPDRPRWSHDKTGASHCPNAPVAEPDPRSIKETASASPSSRKPAALAASSVGNAGESTVGGAS